MIDLKELWIGDLLRIKNSGKKGTFEGLSKEDKVKIKWQGKILLVKTDNFEIIQEEGADFPQPIVDISTKFTSNSRAKSGFRNSLDLHIEKLNPDIENAHPEIILDHQLQMCRSFLRETISKRKNVVTIIHGKGTGALKEEVLHIAKEFKNVRFVVEVNNGGAQEVWMRY